jgi:hypothetical protein
MDLKSLLIAELGKIDSISSKFMENVPISREASDIELLNQADTIEVSRELVLDYLNKSGYELNQQNYDMAYQMLSTMEKENLKKTLVSAENKTKQHRYKTVNHLFDLSNDELNYLTNIAILHSLNKIESNTRIKYYDYVVESVRDINGGTDIRSLSSLLSKYSEKGYRVSKIFTNELGKNAVSVGGIGLNSTEDQVVIIFEKPIYDEF